MARERIPLLSCAKTPNVAAFELIAFGRRVVNFQKRFVSMVV